MNGIDMKNCVIIKRNFIRAKTRKIIIYYVCDETRKEYGILVITKRLVDREKRIVTETATLYSVLSFFMLKEAMGAFVGDNSITPLTNDLIAKIPDDEKKINVWLYTDKQFLENYKNNLIK